MNYSYYPDWKKKKSLKNLPCCISECLADIYEASFCKENLFPLIRLLVRLPTRTSPHPPDARPRRSAELHVASLLSFGRSEPLLLRAALLQAEEGAAAPVAPSPAGRSAPPGTWPCSSCWGSRTGSRSTAPRLFPAPPCRGVCLRRRVRQVPSGELVPATGRTDTC